MTNDPKDSRGSADAAASPESSRSGQLRAELLARMGHELRTPLNAIIGFIKLVEEGLYSTEEERQDYLANARQSALTLLDLINNILDLARIEAGRMTLESLEVNLAELVEGVAKTLAPEAHAKGVDIEVLVDPAIPAPLKSDPIRLRQVLYNLAGNAVKFTDAGLVLLHAELEENGPDRSQVRFSVRDTGVGVPPERQLAIFESFVQEPQHSADRQAGVGLGLSIAKQIVEQMGARIALDSRVHEGSTFSFSLGLPRGRTYGSSSRARAASLGGTKVLVVNPDIMTRDLYLAKLEAIGARGEGAESTDAALERLASAQEGATPVRVVLLDDHLRRDDLLVFARRVRGQHAWFQPDLVYLAIIGSLGDAAAMREAGMTAFVTKPVSPMALRGALAALLEHQGEHGVPLLAAPSDAAPTAASPTIRRTAQVLVAEDNIVNQKLIHALLTKQGYGTRLVANGREAIEALRGGHFDLVLMDVQMPVLDGLAATRAVRQVPGLQKLPIIAMTADALDGDRERCLAAGMDDYVPKPIMPDVLQRTLAKWLYGPAEPDPTLSEDPPDPPLDVAHLQAVHDYAREHDPQRFDALLAVFRGEAEAALEALDEAAQASQPSALRSAAHRLALACAGFGAPRLLALARQAHHDAETATPQELASLMTDLQTAWRGLDAALVATFGPVTHPVQP